jgi:hypothetical protein
VTDRRCLAGALLAAMFTYVALFALGAYVSWDVLQQRNPSLFYRVNAIRLESELESGLADPVSALSILLFNALTIGVACAVGAFVCPARRWFVPVTLCTVALGFWVYRYGLLLLGLDVLGAKAALLFDLTTMTLSGFGGTWLAPERSRE